MVHIGCRGAFAEAPKVDLSKLAGREIKVKAGEPIRVDVPVTGSPPPIVSWQKDNKSLSPSDRVSIINFIHRKKVEKYTTHTCIMYLPLGLFLSCLFNF